MHQGQFKRRPLHDTSCTGIAAWARVTGYGLDCRGRSTDWRGESPRISRIDSDPGALLSPPSTPRTPRLRDSVNKHIHRRRPDRETRPNGVTSASLGVLGGLPFRNHKTNPSPAMHGTNPAWHQAPLPFSPKPDDRCQIMRCRTIRDEGSKPTEPNPRRFAKSAATRSSSS